MHRMIPPVADLLGGGIGIAAVALVAGWVFLTWQRDRHRFVLMQTALEKGINRFPDAPPFWLVSLRQGLTMAALGMALLAVGAGAYWLGHSATPPTAEVISQSWQMQPPPPQLDRGGPPRPPVQSPTMEKWHEAQVEVTLGLGSAAIGIILTFVGIVRVVFAQAERQYFIEQQHRDSNP